MTPSSGDLLLQFRKMEINPLKNIAKPWRFSSPVAGPARSPKELGAELRQMVEIDSCVHNPTGVAQMQKLVARKLSELGFQLQFKKSPSSKFADLLIGERKGRRKEFISFITHVDTVLPLWGERPYQLTPDGLYAKGSGVLDNKGGLVVALEALRVFVSGETPEYSLRFICSPNEEVGSTGFTSLFSELGQDTVIALGMEPALENGSIINCRRGNRWYDIRVKGREAHAGRSYGFHANAAHDLARKIYKIQKLTNYTKHQSVSVGYIQAGKGPHNVVCGEAYARLDLRFSSLKSRDRLHQVIENILMSTKEISVCGNFRAETQYEIVDDCPPFSPNLASMFFSKSYLKCLSQVETRKVKAETSGGAGDVNHLSKPWTIVLDGLGPVGRGMHTEDETVELATLSSRSQALANFLTYCQTKRLKLPL